MTTKRKTVSGISIDTIINRVEPWHFDTFAEGLRQLYSSVYQLKLSGYSNEDVVAMAKSITKKVDSDLEKIRIEEERQAAEWEAQEVAQAAKEESQVNSES